LARSRERIPIRVRVASELQIGKQDSVSAILLSWSVDVVRVAHVDVIGYPILAGYEIDEDSIDFTIRIENPPAVLPEPSALMLRLWPSV
jgi:hypothetical protein